MLATAVWRRGVLLAALLSATALFAQNVDMTASISDSPDPVTLGTDDIVYTATLTNASSGVTATNPTLTVTVPAASSVQGASATGGGTCNTATPPTITCTWAAFSGFASRTVTIAITPLAGGSLVATAAASASETDPTPGNNNASATTTVNASIDMRTSGLSESIDPITLGTGNVTYTVTIINESSSKATNAFVDITIPGTSTFVSATPTNSGTCGALTGSTFRCDWSGALNSFNQRQVSVTVTPTAGGTMTISATAGCDQPEADNSDNTLTQTTTVNASIDMRTSGVSDSIDPITLGTGNVSYTVTIINESSSKATNAFVDITIPGTATFVSSSASNSGTCGALTGSTFRCDWSGDLNSFNQRQAFVTVTPTVGGTMTLSATAGADQPEADNSDNTLTQNTTVNASIDMRTSGVSDSIDPITLGTGNVTYTVTILNESSSKATNAFVDITIPGTATFVSSSASNSGSCGALTGSTFRCDWSGDLNSFNQRQAFVTVTPTVGGTMTLSATAGADQPEADNTDNTLTQNTTVNASIDMRTSGVSDSIDPITLGTGNVTYTVTILNESSSKATNAFVDISIPGTATFVSSSASNSGTCGALTGSTFRCDWSGDLNSFNQRQAFVTVTPTVGGTMTLSATAGADQPEADNSDNTLTQNTTVNASIDMRTSGVSDSIDPITLGTGNVSYTVTIINESSSKATNAFVDITIPGTATFVSSSASNSGTCGALTGSTFRCDWSGDLNSFNQRQAFVTVTPTVGGTMTLSATAGADQPEADNSDNTLTQNTTVNASIDMRTSGVSDSIDPITLGTGNVTYTVTILNESSSKATNAFVDITIPGTATFVSATPSNSGTCGALTGSTFRCDWSGDLNSFNQRQVTVTVTPTVGGTMTLSATAGADQPEADNTDNTLAQNTTVNAQIDMRTSGVSDSIDPITLGTGNVTYTVTIINESSSKATNAFVDITKPTASTFVSATPSNSGTCGALTGNTFRCDWAGDLNSFNQRQVTVVVTPTSGGTMTLSATAGADQPEADNSDNTLSQTTTVNASIDLTLTVSDSPDPRVLGAGNITYTVNILNTSTSKATNPVAAITLPSPSNFVSAAASNSGTCTPPSGGALTCSWSGDLNSFNSRTVTVIVTPTNVGQISFTASVTSDQPDPNAANGTETETTNVNPSAPPTITTFSPGSGPVGTTVTLTGTNFFSTSSVKFNGVSATFNAVSNTSMTAVVPAGATTGLISVTNFSGTTSSGGNFTVTPAPDLTISKTASAPTVATGAAFSYSIAVSNNGAGAANDVTVVDTLPAGVTFQSISAAGWSCSGTSTITCTMGPLASIAAATVITINVTAPATGTTVTNTATVSSTTPETSTANNSSSVAVGVVGCPSTPPITAPATVCAGSTGHTASTPAVPGATYSWLITNGVFTSLTTGDTVTFDASTTSPITLSVSVMVAACPTVSNSVNVNVSTPTATITPSGPTTFCTGGSVTLSANNGSAWLWSTGATTQSIVVSASDVVTVQVTDAAGCTATSAPTTVTVNPTPPPATITPSGPTTFCAGGSVTLNASAGASWLWSNGATGSSIVVNTSDVLSVQITDANGCTATSAPVTVTVNPTPPTPTITPDGPTTFCAGAGDDVTLTASNGASWLWSNGATSQSIVVSASDTLTVQVTDANGCSATSAPVTVTVNPAATPATITAGGPTAFCAGGSVVLTASNGTSWLWNNGATTQSITVSTSGAFDVKVFDGNGCASVSAPTTVVVNAPPSAAVTASGPTTFCAGGSVTLTAPAGMASYAWSNGDSSPSTVVATSGSYSVVVTDTNGCAATSTPVAVTVQNPPVASITAGGPTTFCTGGSVTLTASAGTSWLWSNGAVTQSITVSTGGSYSVEVTGGGGCSALSAPTAVTVNPPPVVTITGPAASCAGAPVVLDAGPGTSWLWNTGAMTQQITVSPGATTTYTATVTNAAGCSATDSHTVTISASPVATIAAPAAVCENAPGNTATVASQPGATYAWTIANGTLTSAANANAVTFTAGPSGQVTLGVTVTTGSCVSTGNVQVPVSAYPAVAISGPTTICPNASLTLSVPATFSSYLWSTGAQGPTITVSQSAASQTYSITVTNAAGCAATATHTVTLVAQPDATITAPASAEPFASLSASVPPQPGATFLWSVFNGTITSGQGTNAIDFTTGASGVTNLSVDVALSGCIASNGTSVAIGDAPPTCETQPPSLTAPANGATVDSPVLLQWTAVAGATSYDVFLSGLRAGSTATTSIPVAVPAGSYTWHVVANLAGDCAPLASAPRTFAVQGPPSDPCATRATAIPLAPENNATVTSSSILFRWSPAFGASAYRLWASVDGAAFAVLGTTDDTSLRATLERGTVLWYAEALYDGCASTESQRFRFTIPAAQNCGTARPTLLAPANGAVVTNASVTFTWSSVAGALGYEVYLGLEEGTAALIGTTTGATSLTHAVPPGTLQWFVRALVDRCPARDSQTSSFTFAEPPTCEPGSRPVLIEPLDDVRATSPLSFSWSASAGATKYELFVVRGNSAPQLVATTTATQAANIAVQPGNLSWFVRASFGQGCASLDSSEQSLQIVPTPAVCTPLAPPTVSAPGQISAGASLRIQWSPVAGASAYQLQLADDSGFATNVQTIDTNGTQHPLTPMNESPEVRAIYARVRALDLRCASANASAFGPPAAIFILPRNTNEGSAPQSDPTPLAFTFVLGSEYAGQSFVATPKQPWLTVTPASGVVAAEGTTLNVVADTDGLPVGTSLGAISVTLTSAANAIATNSTSTVNTSFSVSLVTPVTYDPKSTPPPDALIIPAVAHADGINSKFQSDVRVSNTSAQLIKYQLTFTPSGEGFAQGQQSTFSIEPGATVALDDILRTWFGTGTGSAMGTLEVRPLTETQTSSSGLLGLANLVTFASSRTFNVTANGTFGQYIPAVPFANFIGRERILSLQQIAQSSKYRTNLGLLEASGEPVSLTVRVFGQAGEYLTDFPVDLKGGQHLQLNSFLRDQGLNSLSDGRVEVEVISGNGKVTAYASVLDNDTSDPLLVTPVTIDSVGATKWVVPGVADLVSGFANWQTDMRLFNAGTAPVDVTLAFHSQGGGEPKVRTLTIPAGQVRQFDKTLASLFETTNDGGAVHITTADPAKLIATARTYNETGTGTYGQFISAVTPAEAAGIESRPLQLLQVEESDRFRSNIGLVEVTGKPVKLEISVVPPDAKFTAVVELDLAANEFRQLGSLLASMGLDDTYNARVTVRAVAGEGRVTAYASVIDMETNDPTYIPAQ